MPLLPSPSMRKGRSDDVGKHRAAEGEDFRPQPGLACRSSGCRTVELSNF